MWTDSLAYPELIDRARQFERPNMVSGFHLKRTDSSVSPKQDDQGVYIVRIVLDVEQSQIYSGRAPANGYFWVSYVVDEVLVLGLLCIVPPDHRVDLLYNRCDSVDYDETSEHSNI